MDMQPPKSFDLNAFRREVLADPLVQNVWDNKYRLKRPDGFAEQSIEESKRRVVEAVYAQDPDKKALEEALDAVLSGYFLPAGRINAGAGTGRNVTHMNCYVADTVQDSMPGIQKAIAKDAFTLQQGGGVGMDFSTVRPAGAIVSRTGSVASGSIAFMEQRSAMSATVCSAGERRGALMTTLRCDHPDLWNEEQFETATDYNGNKFLKNPSFISVKRQTGRLTQTNISVLVTDAFMQAVEKDADWDLGFFVPRADGKHVDVYEKPFPYDAFEIDNDFVQHLSASTFAKGDMHPWYVYRRVNARRIWDDIMRSTYKYAEPGVIFIDRMNSKNNLQYCETINCTNPCLAEGALVSTPLGLVPVETVKAGDRVCTIDGVHPIASVERHEKAVVFDVLLSDGSTLTATAAHIFHVANGKKFDIDTRLDRLQVGDKIRLAPTIPPKVGKVSPTPTLGERDFGFLVGATIGDGCYTEDAKNVKIVCRIDEPDWIEALRCVMPADAGIHKSTDAVSTVASRQLMTFFDKVKLGRGYSHEKCLPLHLFNSNEDFLRGYIDGMISTDGNVHMSSSNPMIRVSSNNKNSLLMLKRAMACFGVLARIYPDGDKKVGDDRTLDGRLLRRKYQGYTLVVLGSGLRVIYDRIGITRPSRKERLRQLVRSYSLTGCTWTASVVSIKPAGRATVYDLYEPETDTWVTEGVVNRGCGEQCLPPHGCCDLGSVNIAFMVDDPFTPKAKLNFDVLRKTVHTAVRFLDNVLDVSAYPLREQREESMNKRRIGLGLTGVADALLQMGVRYGSLAAQNYLNYWTKFIQEHSYRASANLAAERGPFPLFRRDDFLASPNVAKISEKARDLIKKNGIRNGVLNTVAPNGTISIYSGNTGQGIEPIFSFDKVTRKVRQPDGTLVPYESVNYAYRLYEAMHGSTERKDLPDYFVGAMDIPPSEHILMQAACQEFIDASISKTVNVPTETTFEDFKDLYVLAYQMGCKGTTTYRFDPDSGRGSVLSVEEPKPVESTPQNVSIKFEVPVAGEGLAFDKPNVAPRDRILQGRTYKVKWPPTGKNWYVTINHDADSVPVEVFITGGEEGHVEWIQAMGRLLTAVLRRGGDVKFLVNELTAVHAAGAGGFIAEQHAYRPSVVAAIGGVLEEEFKALGLYGDPRDEGLPTAPPMVTQPHTLRTPAVNPVTAVMGPVICPNCHVGTLIREEGCMRCVSCDYSKCG